MWQEINSCHKKSILVTRNQLFSQEINFVSRNQFCHKKLILVKRNQFLSQELFLVSSYPLVKLILSIRENAWILSKNSLQLKHFVGTWFPGSQRICRPGLRHIKIWAILYYTMILYNTLFTITTLHCTNLHHTTSQNTNSLEDTTHLQ